MAIPDEKDGILDPSEFPANFLIPSDPGEARRIQDKIVEGLQAHHYNEKDVFAVKLALEEAVVNAIKHGNQMDRSKKVRIAYKITPDQCDILIADEGPGFDPAEVPDPTNPENLERHSGRGVMLMRHYMNEVHFSPRGNSVRMSKQPTKK
jgi:serine/threonine-protein kinase RsbW